MKTIYKTVFKYFGVLILGIILTTSCEDFLDKSPKVNITDETVFKKFITFQGFMEEAYQCIVDPSHGMAGTSNYNFGDDILLPSGTSTGFCSPEFDRGNYWVWNTVTSSPFMGNISSVNSSSDKGYWQSGWYGIRLCNLALANVKKLIDGTDEERNLISGQAYFFRGYFHFEILRSWGGIPYIDTVFAPTDALRKPRLSYKQTADKITADLRKAAELLPANWDETTVGQLTLTKNAGRITKQAAYGYIGKNLLYAASPLMNGLETGNSDVYNVELCKQAAEAFNEVIKLTDQGYQGLETWADYKNVFYTVANVNIMPRGKEIIFMNPMNAAKTSGNNTGELKLANFGGFGVYAGPTENYIENFGMKNGLPIDAAGSGYDPDDPWASRDPRFDYSVLVDGDKLMINPCGGYPDDATFKSYVGGRHRTNLNSATGYGTSKYVDIGCNPCDGLWSIYYWDVCAMRLPDIYLMYAEAVNEAYGPVTAPSNIPGGMTAEAAVNIVRRRVEISPGVPLPDVDPRYLNKDAFREIIRQERAVELAFEAHRWYDIRRWHVAHTMKYREKFALDFTAAHTNFKKTLVTTTVFEDKHYWLPFPVDQVTLYPEFNQNPGW